MTRLQAVWHTASIHPARDAAGTRVPLISVPDSPLSGGGGRGGRLKIEEGPSGSRYLWAAQASTPGRGLQLPGSRRRLPRGWPWRLRRGGRPCGSHADRRPPGRGPPALSSRPAAGLQPPSPRRPHTAASGAPITCSGASKSGLVFRAPRSAGRDGGHQDRGAGLTVDAAAAGGDRRDPRSLFRALPPSVVFFLSFSIFKTKM